MAVAPSPTADATRFTERERTSPAANTPVRGPPASASDQQHALRARVHGAHPGEAVQRVTGAQTLPDQDHRHAPGVLALGHRRQRGIRRVRRDDLVVRAEPARERCREHRARPIPIVDDDQRGIAVGGGRGRGHVDPDQATGFFVPTSTSHHPKCAARR
ncbi:MAG TPA: hypothetical protein VL225_17260 [Vicinamibacterales bacterium]|nr:hypothetical protein [Vicinamibacterales bacterium]